MKLSLARILTLIVSGQFYQLLNALEIGDFEPKLEDIIKYCQKLWHIRKQLGLGGNS